LKQKTFDVKQKFWKQSKKLELATGVSYVLENFSMKKGWPENAYFFIDF